MSSRNSLTREDWVSAAQHMLMKSGIDAVRVDTLAKELKITRGSFYYHFKSRQDLLDAVLANWRAKATEHVINSLREAKVPPREQLQWLLGLPLHGQSAHDAASIELAIRGWARRDKHVRQAMDEVDSYRLQFIESLLVKLGLEEDAASRAYLIYAYQLSLSMVQTSGTADQRAHRHDLVARLLLQGSDVALN
ncbi:TetR family transcriptional regulator [Alcanivorax sp. S71-1-4]|uniref:TetR/AcrR family transcriptional regulator n=1 Tax=Alcanivorax sp. S71-1-4 TaxID=1177159 RepID=UPI00135725B0|nr:TetR/AcrR family transcriptional regulator [Alcanivorax sp. S71-1-4]KAF0808708.1 TetR family transcriptional regulator [Alcanivorax sp. S71-1-4]